MDHEWPRDNVWQVVFVLVNLLALGLTGWVIDSVNRWGYTLSGFELLFAFGVAALLVLSSVFGTALLWVWRRALSQHDGTEDTDENVAEETTNNSKEEVEKQTLDPDPIQDSGDSLPSATGQTAGTTTTSGNFAVEGFGPGANNDSSSQEP
ncbi:hypothetical protein VB773_19700 [Haloarculaceae archaeon H-GB2-1]|nr:hypothetical protein [Haloarculaceae archaeon H-GB1-1]MEA5409581.1 hypothetical protein [Haloarculaceae archaeon H-GB2-1]